MKKITSLLLALITAISFCFGSAAIGDTSAIPSKTLNKITDDFRKAMKNGETSVSIASYGVYDDSSGKPYTTLLGVLAYMSLDILSFSFGKYTENIAVVKVNKNSSGLLSEITITYPKQYMKEDGKCDIKQIEADKKIVSARYKEAQKVVKKDMTDIEKALALYDYVITNCSYSSPSGIDENGKELFPEFSYSASGLLIFGDGVCSAYAKVLALLLNEAGVQAITVASNSMNHEWVMLKINGKWYHADPTFDDTRTGRGLTAYFDSNDDKWDEGAVSHYFFLKSDEEIKNLGYHDWVPSMTVNPDFMTESPVSGDSGAFDDYFFSPKNEDFFTFSAMNRINGFWYFTDLNSNSVVRTTIDGEPELIPMPIKDDSPKYAFAYGNDLYISTFYDVYRFDTLSDRFDRIIEIRQPDTGEKRLGVMSINYDEMMLRSVTYIAKGDDNYDCEYETDTYPMADVSVMEALPSYDDDDPETADRSGNEKKTTEPSFTKPAATNRIQTVTASPVQDTPSDITTAASDSSDKPFNILFIVIPAGVLVISVAIVIVKRIKR